MVDLATELCDGSFAAYRVGILGAAFKPDSDDIRDSPALNVALTIQKAGAAVRVYDPQAMTNAKNELPTLAYAVSADEACRDADVVLHLTEWRAFRDIDPEEFGDLVSRRNIVDDRNALDAERWPAGGLDVSRARAARVITRLRRGQAALRGYVRTGKSAPVCGASPLVRGGLPCGQ